MGYPRFLTKAAVVVAGALGRAVGSVACFFDLPTGRCAVLARAVGLVVVFGAKVGGSLVVGYADVGVG